MITIRLSKFLNYGFDYIILIISNGEACVLISNIIYYLTGCYSISSVSMSEQDDIGELTRQLLWIHIDRERLATEERAILERLAKLASNGIRREKTRTKVKQEEQRISTAKKGSLSRISDKRKVQE